MCERVVIKQVNEQFVIRDECGGNERVWKVGVTHGIVINSNQSINVHFIGFDFFLGPGSLAKSP